MKVLFFFTLVILAACNQSAEKKSTDPVADSLPATSPDAGVSVLADTTESLHNFWVLEGIDDKPVFADAFTLGAPYLNLDLEKNTVSGFGGCNGMNGSMKAEGDKIVFGKITSAGVKTDCTHAKFEKKYLNNLSGRTVTFELQPGRLKLKVHDGSVYSYRKIK